MPHLSNSTGVEQVKDEIRNKIIDIWNNPDNPAEDKLIEIFEFSAETIINYLEYNNVNH